MVILVWIAQHAVYASISDSRWYTYMIKKTRFVPNVVYPNVSQPRSDVALMYVYTDWSVCDVIFTKLVVILLIIYNTFDPIDFSHGELLWLQVMRI
jgi:hypothetical protein